MYPNSIILKKKSLSIKPGKAGYRSLDRISNEL